MRKKVLVLLALTAIGLMLEARVIVVDGKGTGDYLTIQEGIAAANSGDTVFVKKGLYYTDEISGEIILKLPINLIGERMDSTIINASAILGGDIAVGKGVQGCIITRFTLTTGLRMSAINPVVGIYCYISSPVITYNTFLGVYGVECEGNASPVVNYNNFYNNSIWPTIQLSQDSLNIDARYNYWMTTDSAEIINKIYDRRSDSALGIIDFTPWLDEPVAVTENQHLLPRGIFLNQNIPNPFSKTTTIFYGINGKYPKRVALKIYSVIGTEIKTLVDEIQTPGNHSVTWDGSTGQSKYVPKGVYFYGLKVNNELITKKLIIIKEPN